MTHIDQTINSVEFGADVKHDSINPTIAREDIKEYLLQLREMKEFSLVGYVDMLPPGMKEVPVHSIITGGRNCQIEVQGDVYDFKNCPFHIRFTTEYGGQWHPNTPTKLKESMTRKFMDEPLKRGGLSQPRTALDYLYTMSVDESLNPDPRSIVVKKRYDEVQAKLDRKEGKKKPTFNIYLSYHNVSSNTNEDILSFHRTTRLSLAKECFNHVFTNTFELHIVGIVTGAGIEAAKQEHADYAVNLRVPAFLVYARPLSKGDGHSYAKTKAVMNTLMGAGHGITVKDIATRFEMTEAEILAMYSKTYDPSFGISKVITMPTFGAKVTVAPKANVEKPVANTTVTVTPTKPVVEEEQSKVEEPTKDNKEESSSAKPKTLSSMRARYEAKKAAANKEEVKSESPVANSTVTPTKPPVKEESGDAVKDLNAACANMGSDVFIVNPEKDIDNVDEGADLTNSNDLFSL